MLIHVGYDIIFDLPAATPMLLMLNLHSSRMDSIRKPEALRVEPEIPIQQFHDLHGNFCSRLVAPPGQFRLFNDAIVADSGAMDEADWNAVQHPVECLPNEVLPFLLPSRFCEVDLLKDLAWTLFSTAAPGRPRVQAVCDWCHANIQFGYQYARVTKTAAEVYRERTGVCRDFTHLSIAFCRALNIPARYATGYLGDIGVPIDPAPMDFCAWFEVYLGGRWWTLDARHNVPRIGRVLMAHGRDAIDVALTTAFGVANLKKFTVWAEEVRG